MGLHAKFFNKILANFDKIYENKVAINYGYYKIYC